MYSIDPEDEEFQDITKNARRKLEVPMPAEMPCKTPVNGSGETCRSVGKHKTEYACIVEADESMRVRLEGVPLRYHEAKQQWKKIGKIGKDTGMAADESQKQK